MRIHCSHDLLKKSDLIYREQDCCEIKDIITLNILHLWRFKTPIFYNNLYINYYKTT